jgi:hypothetical protein
LNPRSTDLSATPSRLVDTLPVSRGELLEKAGPSTRRIFHMARGLLDQLDAAAPWDALYYPPLKAEEVAAMLAGLVTVIDSVGHRVQSLMQDLAGDAASQELVDDLEFFFQGIQMSVASEVEQLRARAAEFRARPAEFTEQKAEFACELGADIKGKMTSSMMGAASSLIAGARWNGVEIEPILFPEKAEEFERNGKLVETLAEVMDSIASLLSQIPLAALVEKWREGRRVDQYALTPLYSFLGNLGRLMQESSRRALYSGDYHQIRRRENRLSTRIAELTTLHNMTWGVVPTGAQVELQAIYPVMVKKATELAAVLHLDIVRQIAGPKMVDEVLAIVTLEKDGGTHSRRERLPEELKGLVPLLYDEDLKTFLELLLGSVLKRASLTVGRDRQAADARAAAATAALPPLARPAAESAPSAPVNPAAGREGRLRALEDLQALLGQLGSRANPDRKSFELIHRLLKQQRTVPPAMLQSMHPYLYGLMNELIPRLNDSSHFGNQLGGHAASLIQLCQALCQPLPAADQLQNFPQIMQRLLNLIDGLSSAAAASIEKLRAGGA